MVSEFLVEIWFEATERHWMTKAEVCCPIRPVVRPEMESDYYYEEITKLPIRKSKVKISDSFPRLHRQINNAHDGMDNEYKQEVTGATNDITTMPAKIFCSHGSHVTFLDEVRRRYNRCTPTTKATYKSALGEYRTLPRKLVRYGRKPWKPVSVLCSDRGSRIADWDRLNWTLLTEDRLILPRVDVMETDNKSVSVVEHEPKVENHCLKEDTRHPEPSTTNKRYKKHSDTVMNMDTAMYSLLSKHHFDIDINDTDATQKSWRSPKPHLPTNRNTRSASDGAHQQPMNTEKSNPRTFSTAGEDYRLQRDNIVLHFDAPVTTNKRRKSVDKENSVAVRLNCPPSPDDDTALPLTAPIIEKDDIDFGCSPTLPRRRKSSEKREHRKVKLEVNDPKELKEHRKGFWFGKNENKTKTSDENTSANTTTEHKSKFKKQHRKSKSVLVPPTYLDANPPQDKTTQPKEKPTLIRKSSLGNSPKALTRKLSFGSSPKTRKVSVGSPPKDTKTEKTEKTGLFRRFYASPHTDKKFEERADDLMTPLKRTRRYTQPVGDIQKEFIRELKGKLDKYSSEHTIKPANETREKVIWNMHI